LAALLALRERFSGTAAQERGSSTGAFRIDRRAGSVRL
jgi:hypothetical protein